jgi:hypothetical protein
LKRKLWAFNILLIAAIALAGWSLRKEAREYRAREHATLDKHPPIPPPPAQPPMVPAPTVTASAYIDIAQKMLLARDRNSQIIVDPPKPPDPPKALPPLPSVHGVMDIGDGPIVMMSEQAGGRHRGVRVGENIGKFKLVSVSKDELVLAFEDRKVKKSIQELIDRGGAAAADAAAQPGAAGTGTAAPSAPAPPPPAGQPVPGVALSSELANCTSNDSSPAGTVVNGMRKVTRKTPFGETCYWEAAK